MDLRQRPGFTLIEVIVIIAILSVIASIAVPYAFKLINQEKRSSTMKEMQGLQTAILGDPGIGEGGYVGDMGVLPVNNDLRALVQRRFGSVVQPVGQTDAYGVKYGWFGPYLNVGFDSDAFMEDEWGTPYRYGDPGTGQIRSAGEDKRFGTSDDIIYPPNPVNIYGRLLVNVFVWDGAQYVQNPSVSSNPAMTMSVTVYFSNSGVRSSVSLSTPSSPPYTYLNLHQGQHAVVGVCDLDGPGPIQQTSGVMVVFVKGGNSQTVCNLYLR